MARGVPCAIVRSGRSTPIAERRVHMRSRFGCDDTRSFSASYLSLPLRLGYEDCRNRPANEATFGRLFSPFQPNCYWFLIAGAGILNLEPCNVQGGSFCVSLGCPQLRRFRSTDLSHSSST